MKSIYLLLITVFIASATVSAQTPKPGADQLPGENSKAVSPGHHKVIMQITSGDTLAHKALMHQLRNLKEYWADAVSLEVLVQGPALDMVLAAKSSQPEAVAKMQASGIRFVACEFTMKQRNVKANELLPGMETVPFGLVEIITRQEEGWTYLKAGF